jgi:antitoxin component YwqK of YwqJK toxin-antitoxin module
MPSHGPHLSWQEDGQKFMEETYVDGQRDGVSLMRHDNGQKSLERNYATGEARGLFRSWSESGQLRTSYYFGHGVQLNEDNMLWPRDKPCPPGE